MGNKVIKDNYQDDSRIITDDDLAALKSSKSSSRKSREKNSNFNKKYFLCAFLIVLFSFLTAFFIKRSYVILSEENITYQENSNLDYKVYLKKNDFYEEDYLGKNMVYVASLIDRIDVNFNYLFSIDKNSNIDFEYDVIGKLVISDNNKGSSFFEKEYVLLEKVNDSMTSDGFHQINKNVSIDYAKYNNLANQFRSRYGIDANCKLIVYLNIHEKGTSGFNLSNTSNMSLSIPLSERAVNITMDYNEVNKTSKLVRDKGFEITNYLFICFGVLSGLILIFVLIKFIKLILSLRIKKTRFDKYVNKLLREYDRLIVETPTAPATSEIKNIVEVLKFEELLDVRDNLKLPIKYYVVSEHEESWFYINHEEELYLFRVKNEDFKKDR